MSPEQWCPSSRVLGLPPGGNLIGMMKNQIKRPYLIVVTNPARTHSEVVDVYAVSRLHARGEARAELAFTKRDDWNIESVVEAT